jgi:hypothetical protein
VGIYGQDWASYQPAQPDTTSLSFAIIKVTEGLGYTSPVWQQQRDHARSAGLVVGYYHYPHMANSPQAEANRFLALAQPQPGDLVVLDWEGYDSANTNVSHSAQLAYKEAWLRYVKQQVPHCPVGVYCNADYWNNVDTTGYVQDFLWIATAGRPAGDPGIRANWLFHQYGGGDTDLDYCALSSTDALHAWVLAFAPTHEEDPMAAFTEDDIRRFIREEVSSSPVRDTLAFANAWWFVKAATNAPVDGTDPNTWGWMLPTLASTLAQLNPGQLAQLQAAVGEAVKGATVKVEIVTGPAPAPAPAS